jgi:hypothetical protein
LAFTSILPVCREVSILITIAETQMLESGLGSMKTQSGGGLDVVTCRSALFLILDLPAVLMVHWKRRNCPGNHQY